MRAVRVLWIVAAAWIAYLLSDRLWPAGEVNPHGAMPADWKPNPRTIVRVV